MRKTLKLPASSPVATIRIHETDYRSHSPGTGWADAIVPPDGNTTERLYVIHGLSGIGKAFVAKQIIQRLIAKKWCRVIDVPNNSPNYVGHGCSSLLRFLHLRDTQYEDPVSAVASFLNVQAPVGNADRHVVLVLFLYDIDGLPQEDVGEFVRLLELVPRLKIVATSSRSLGLGETLLPLEPLDLIESRRMFLDVARRAGYEVKEEPVAPEGMEGIIKRPVSKAIDQIMVRCGGISAKLKFLAELTTTQGPVQLLTLIERGRVEDPIASIVNVQLRQCSLNAQALFPQLSVFRQGFEIEQAAAIYERDDIDACVRELTLTPYFRHTVRT